LLLAFCLRFLRVFLGARAPARGTRELTTVCFLNSCFSYLKFTATSPLPCCFSCACCGRRVAGHIRYVGLCLSHCY
jgi:hypothetical protein